MTPSSIEKYALKATIRSFKEIIREVEEVYGEGYALKNPGIVSTLLRFQEETFRSVSKLVEKEKISSTELNLSN